MAPTNPRIPPETVSMLPSGGYHGNGTGRDKKIVKKGYDSPLSPIEPAPFRKFRPRSPVPFVKSKSTLYLYLYFLLTDNYINCFSHVTTIPGCSELVVCRCIRIYCVIFLFKSHLYKDRVRLKHPHKNFK